MQPARYTGPYCGGPSLGPLQGDEGARRGSLRGRGRRRIAQDRSDKFTWLGRLERAEWLARGRCCVLPDDLRGPEAQDGEAEADAEPN